jgi:hypothetical protein
MVIPWGVDTVALDLVAPDMVTISLSEVQQTSCFFQGD